MVSAVTQPRSESPVAEVSSRNVHAVPEQITARGSFGYRREEALLEAALYNSGRTPANFVDEKIAKVMERYTSQPAVLEKVRGEGGATEISTKRPEVKGAEGLQKAAAELTHVAIQEVGVAEQDQIAVAVREELLKKTVFNVGPNHSLEKIPGRESGKTREPAELAGPHRSAPQDKTFDTYDRATAFPVGGILNSNRAASPSPQRLEALFALAKTESSRFGEENHSLSTRTDSHRTDSHRTGSHFASQPAGNFANLAAPHENRVSGFSIDLDAIRQELSEMRN